MAQGVVDKHAAETRHESKARDDGVWPELNEMNV